MKTPHGRPPINLDNVLSDVESLELDAETRENLELTVAMLRGDTHFKGRPIRPTQDDPCEWVMERVLQVQDGLEKAHNASDERYNALNRVSPDRRSKTVYGHLVTLH